MGDIKISNHSLPVDIPGLNFKTIAANHEQTAEDPQRLKWADGTPVEAALDDGSKVPVFVDASEQATFAQFEKDGNAIKATGRVFDVKRFLDRTPVKPITESLE